MWQWRVNKIFSEYRGKLQVGRKSIQTYLFGEKRSLSKSIKKYLEHKNNANKDSEKETGKALAKKPMKLENIEQKISNENQKH